MGVPQIPEQLTRGYWQAHKGMIAKMAGYTGISDSMDDVQNAYDAVNWELFDTDKAEKAARNYGIEAFDAQFVRARAEYPKVTELRTKLYELRDRAQEAEKRFRETLLIPASSRRLAGDIAVVAEHFAVELRSMDILWAHSREALVQQFEDWLKIIGITMKTIEQHALTISLLPNPEAELLRKEAQQKCCSVYIYFRARADLRGQLMDDWKEVAQESWYKVPDGQAVRDKARELQLLVARSLVFLAGFAA